MTTTRVAVPGSATGDAIRNLRLENRLRFVLLMAAAATAALAFGESIWYPLLWNVEDAVRDGCAANAAPGATSVCYEPENRERVLWSFTSAIGVLAVATTLALASSAVRRRGLRPLPPLPGVGSDVVAPVLRAYALSGVPVVQSPRRPTRTARADGIRARYVEVGTNWMAYALADPPRARAVLAHECAHLTGRDILMARTSYWLGPVLLVWAVAYAVGMSILVSPDLTDVWLRLAILLPVVHIARLGVLRGREHSADMAASGVERHGLDAALLARAGPTGWRRVWRAVTDPHPTAAARSAVIEAPGLWPRIGPLDGAVVGLVIGVAGPVLGWQWTTWFLADGGIGTLGGLVGWGVVGMMAGAWCAAVTVRAVAVGRRSGLPARLGAFSLAAGAGLAVGQALFRAPVIGYLDRSEFVPRSVLGFAGLIVLCAGLVATVQVLLAVARVLPRARSGLLGVVGIVLGAVLLGTGGYLTHAARTLEASGSGAGVYDLLGHLLVLRDSVPGYALLVVLAVLVWVFGPASGRPAPTAVLRAAAVAVSAGLLACALVAVVAGRAGPTASNAANWYAARLSTLMLTFLPVVAALTVGLGVAIVGGPGFVRRAISLSVVGGVVAATAPAVVTGVVHGGPVIPALTYHLPRVVPLVFLGALLVSGVAYSVGSLLPRRPGRTGRASLAIGALVCAGAASLSVAWLAPAAVPDTPQDVDAVWTSVIEADAAYSVCAVGGAAPDPAAQAALDALAGALADDSSWSRPATGAGLEVRRLAGELERTCRSAMTDAATRTPAVIAPDSALVVEAAWRRTRDAVADQLVAWDR